MSFKTFLMDGALEDYLPSVALIADNWSALLEPEALEGLDNENFHPRIVQLLESGGLGDDVRLELGRDLQSLAWWRGSVIPLDLRCRIDAVTGPILMKFADDLVLGPRSLPASRLRRAHVLLVGALEDPNHHSPSAAVIDYAAALARDPRIERLEIVHSGAIGPAMSAYITERLGGFPARRGISLVSTRENQGFLADILSRGPCTFHMVCEPHLSPVINIVSRLGPTVMFTCADAVPVQYADVYWFYHSADHMAPIWRGQGAPEVFIGNYVQSLSGPWHETPPPSRLSKSDIGLPDDALVIATVGNRLGIDMDEAYITGMELAVRERPDCVWMVVGGLPEELSGACRQILGSQFLHIPYSTALDQLMTTVDVFANPFRSGGGRSAYIALGAGAAVLTLGQGDACTAIPEDVRAVDVADYFRRLDMLLDSRELLEAFKAYEADYFRMVCDQKAFHANLQKMVRLAGERYVARQGGARLSETVFAPEPLLVRAG